MLRLLARARSFASSNVPQSLARIVKSAAAGIVTVCLVTMTSADAAVVLSRSDTGAPVPTAAAEATLARSGLVARLGPDSEISVYGLSVRSETGAVVYVTLSSQFIAAAVIAGSANSPALAEVLSPGEMISVSIGTNASPNIEAFDVRQFLARPPRGVDKDALETLEAILPVQERKIWWGGLRRTALNLQAPVPPLVEGLRRDYLLEPPVVRLRQEAGTDSDVYALKTAEQFVDALGRRDVAAVRALLHPTLFVGQHGGSGPNWLRRRHDFAGALAGGALPGQMRGATVSVDTDGRMIASGRSGRRWQIVMSPLDVGIFVAAVEPVK